MPLRFSIAPHRRLWPVRPVRQQQIKSTVGMNAPRLGWPYAQTVYPNFRCTGGFLLHLCADCLYSVAEPSGRSPPVMALLFLATTTVGRSPTPATLPLFD